MSNLRGYTLTVPGFATLYTESCYSCGVLFGLATDFYEQRVKDGKTFHCPAGHAQHYTAERTAREKLAQEQATNLALRDQLDAAQRDAETVRGLLARDRQRFVNGVCPCCTRSFDNVRRHMQSKHPDYDVATLVHEAPFKCSCGRKFESYRGLRTHQGHLRPDDWTQKKSDYWKHLTVVG